MPTCTEYPLYSRFQGILLLSQDRSISKERKMKIVKKEIILPLLQDFWCLLFIFCTTSGCFDMLSSIGCIIPKSICLSTVYKLQRHNLTCQWIRVLISYTSKKLIFKESIPYSDFSFKCF